MVPTPALPRLDRPFAAGWFALGFVYWLALVCALEPGNLAKAGAPPDWLHEVSRLLAAGLLGASATPAVLLLAAARRRSLLVKAAGVLAIAFTLIVVSCVLVAWLSEHRAAPSLAAIEQELAANFVLLVFAVAVLMALVSILGASRAGRAAEPPRARPMVFMERGRTLVIDPDDVEWIESQGNYQAVRARGQTHLVRRTLEDLEADLPARRFVRIHRRALVAVRCVESVKAASNGDAVARLADGRELRVSRGRRRHLAIALAPRATMGAEPAEFP